MSYNDFVRDQHERVFQRWFDAGQRAYHEGKARTDYPFKKALRRSGWVVLWQAGWDTGKLGEALKAGAKSAPEARNPYTDPELAASWVQGWNAAHGLRVIGGKNPARREQDAEPGI